MHQKPPRVFYGWWIVTASFFVALYVAGVVFYGFTAVFEPIADEMGWSYTQISLAASLRGLEMGLLAPLSGILADRWGPRRLVFGGGVIAAIGLFLLGRTTSLGTFYGAFVLIAIGMSGCMMTVLMTAVASWFRGRVGIASGIAMSGFGSGGLLVPLIVRLIETYEWRMTMTILALGLLVTVVPLSLVFRHKPEQYGYLPDGQLEDRTTPDNGSRLPPVIEADVTAKQALRSSIFWRIAVVFTCHVLLVTAVITHVMPYLSSIDVVRSRSSLVATAIPLLSIAGRLGLGWLSDRLDRRLLMAGAFAMMGLGLLFFGYAATAGNWPLVPFLILFGIGYGGCNVLRPALVREYFGITSFGTVFGLVIGVSMLGGLAGPSLAGWVYDNWNSYQGIWFIFATLSAVAVISVLTIPASRAIERQAR